MEFFKLKFWFNLSLVVFTSYVLIWYIFSPSKNECQMTFMMEPPRFISVPLETATGDSELNYPEAKLEGSFQNTEGYKLYMYSELGFPQTSNIDQDLKDSTPVLFVPGNAGSYQQVRSLASTCIRRQLQSLDAYKFIFYTIDFKSQLSGVNGKLIEEQTKFVHQALIQISKLHPVNVEGIILVGHSIGGFISKYLFTIPEFNPSLVPLLISLASPLTEPYLSFDDKMRTLYNKANQHWMQKESRFNKTLAISISGGETDRLVPTHLSMDPYYDLSLSTSSMKNVWVETDHVSITWCRELIQKLALLLSSLIDKKRVQVIADKAVAMSIITEELLINQTNYNKEETTVIHKDWNTIKPYQVIDFREYLSVTRSQLSGSIKILNMTNLKNADLLVVIENVRSLKTNRIFGCQDIDSDGENSRLNCIKRVDLMHLAKPLPTRRFEPEKTVLKIPRESNFQLNYMIVDFSSNSNSQGSKIPELITVQELDLRVERLLYIPTLLGFMINRLFFLDDYTHIIKPEKSIPSIHLRFRIMNLKQNTQLFEIAYKTIQCQNTEHQYESVATLTQNGYLSRSFYPTYTANGESHISIKLSPHSTILKNTSAKSDRETYLDLYVDGTCTQSLQVKIDLMGLVVNNIQRNLGKIIAFATYFTYQSIVFHLFNLLNQKVEFRYYSIQHLITFMAFTHRNFLITNSSSAQFDEIEFDTVGSFLLLYISALGMVAYLNYFIKRLIDLATIINNAQSFLRRKCSRVNTSGTTKSKNLPFDHSTSSQSSKFIHNELMWMLITIAITGSLVFSAAVMSLFKIFSVIKLKLSLDSSESEPPQGCSINRHLDKKTFNHKSEISELLISVAVFCTLAFISNIPAALTRLNRLNSIFNLIESAYQEVYFVASAMSLILIKKICDQIELLSKRSLEAARRKEEKRPSTQIKLTFPASKLYRVWHLISLWPILLVESNLCNIILALFTCLGWLYCYMLKINTLQFVDKI